MNELPTGRNFIHEDFFDQEIGPLVYQFTEAEFNAYELEDREFINENVQKLVLENKELELKNSKLELINTNIKQNIKLRKVFSWLIFSFMAFWMAFVGLYLMLAGYSVIQVSETVQVAIITTGTAQVIGIFLVVSYYLFPRPKHIDQI